MEIDGSLFSTAHRPAALRERESKSADFERNCRDEGGGKEVGRRTGVMHHHHLREPAQLVIEAEQARYLMVGMSARVAEHDGFCAHEVSVQIIICLLGGRGG